MNQEIPQPRNDEPEFFPPLVIPKWKRKTEGITDTEDTAELSPEVLKTPEDWIEELCPEVSIVDPDGWRGADAPAFDEPISREDFRQRLLRCTADKIPEELYRPQDLF